jgi:uncharacterized membrane protein YczE
LVVRTAMFLAGAVLSTYCYALTIKANIGLGPLFAFQDGVARTAGIALGTSVTLVGVGMIILAALFRSWPSPGTIVLPFLTGAILAPLVRISPTLHGYFPRFVLVIGATWLMALGGALSIRCAFGASAYSQLMLVLHRLTRWRIVFAQLAMELTMLTLGWILGGSIGVGTLITGLLIGPSLQFWLRLIGGIPAGVTPVVPAHEAETHHAALVEVTGEALAHYSDELESALSESTAHPEMPQGSEASHPHGEARP